MFSTITSAIDEIANFCDSFTENLLEILAQFKLYAKTRVMLDAFV